MTLGADEFGKRVRVIFYGSKTKVIGIISTPIVAFYSRVKLHVHQNTGGLGLNLELPSLPLAARAPRPAKHVHHLNAAHSPRAHSGAPGGTYDWSSRGCCSSPAKVAKNAQLSQPG